MDVRSKFMESDRLNFKAIPGNAVTSHTEFDGDEAEEEEGSNKTSPGDSEGDVVDHCSSFD